MPFPFSSNFSVWFIREKCFYMWQENKELKLEEGCGSDRDWISTVTSLNSIALTLYLPTTFVQFVQASCIQVKIIRHVHSVELCPSWVRMNSRNSSRTSYGVFLADETFRYGSAMMWGQEKVNLQACDATFVSLSASAASILAFCVCTWCGFGLFCCRCCTTRWHVPRSVCTVTRD